MKTNNQHNVGDIVWFFDSEDMLCQGKVIQIQFEIKHDLKVDNAVYPSLHVTKYAVDGGIFLPEELHKTPEGAMTYHEGIME